ncbi:hypothetical protein ANN_27247 [Periplaneta americana]|uniref:Uncharacterized protein n=1 Tax=Periplaneta americana TaxID=6978 RepID=A0ABQ8RXH3_PERAM|nr:hypothetical protein ANN_27247 [Periplaneta americana]
MYGKADNAALARRLYRREAQLQYRIAMYYKRLKMKVIMRAKRVQGPALEITGASHRSDYYRGGIGDYE